MPPSPSPSRIKLTLRPAAEVIVKKGHPWIFSESIKTQNREGEAGELAVIYDRRNRFLGVGLYDPDSPIRVRLLHTGAPAIIDDAWWQQHLEDTLARRRHVATETTNGLRLINGESDGWPGLILDRYDTTLVLKLYSAAWLPRLDEVKTRLLATLSPERLVLRLSRNLQARAAEFEYNDPQILHGSLTESRIPFLESGLHFEADVLHGQKTGFFLDQRENRRRVETLAKHADVLNAFSYTGGFSLYAARGGAKSVTDLDISAHALAASERNFALNRADSRIASCQHRTIQGDAFAWIEAARPASYDLVIVDPPSLAKREAERERAIQAYGKLNANAIRLLRRKGILVAASCSAHVSEMEFFGTVRNAALKSGRRFVELGTSLHAHDHPATFPEAQYLKCLILRMA